MLQGSGFRSPLCQAFCTDIFKIVQPLLRNKYTFPWVLAPVKKKPKNQKTKPNQKKPHHHKQFFHGICTCKLFSLVFVYDLQFLSPPKSIQTINLCRMLANRCSVINICKRSDSWMLTRPWKYFHPTFNNFCLQIQLTVDFQHARVQKFGSGKERLSSDNKLGRGKKERQGPERIERRKRTAGGAESVTGTAAKHMAEGKRQKQAKETAEVLCQTRDCQYKKTDKNTEIRKRPEKLESHRVKQAWWQQPANWEGAVMAKEQD